MFSTDSGPQSSTINFRLKNATGASSIAINFTGREIKVSDLREKIAERLQAASGQHLMLYDGSSGRLFSEESDKVPAYTEIHVVRTMEEASSGSSAAVIASRKPSNAAGGGAPGGAPGAAGGGGGDSAASAAVATKTATGETKRAMLDFGGSGPLLGKGMTEEEAIAALADDVARDTGAGTAQFGGRGGGARGGGMNMGGRGGGAANSGKPLALSNTNPLGQAPSERVTCILCGKKGHWPSECPELQAAKATRGGGGNVGGGGVHLPRRYAMAAGIPESELEICSPEEASHITSKGDFVRRRVVGLGLVGGLIPGVNNNNTSDADGDSQKFKCLHCGTQSSDAAFFSKLPCGTAECCIACKNCVASDKFMELSDDGPICVKCGNEIDADEIRVCKAAADFDGTDAMIGGGGGAVRRERE